MKPKEILQGIAVFIVFYVFVVVVFSVGGPN